MNSSYLAKILLVSGLFIWGASEWNLLNTEARIQRHVEVFDHDYGDDRMFSEEYRVVVDWGDQQYVYGNGYKEITLKRSSSWTYDLSWVPFFKSYRQKSVWTAKGTPFHREPIDLTVKYASYGFVSRSDVISAARMRASKRLIQSFQEQSFYESPFFRIKKNRIFSGCFH